MAGYRGRWITATPPTGRAEFKCLQQVIEGKIKGGIEVTGRRGRRRRNLLYDLKERRGYSLQKGY
jgi:hypothetical protein